MSPLRRAHRHALIGAIALIALGPLTACGGANDRSPTVEAAAPPTSATAIADSTSTEVSTTSTSTSPPTTSTSTTTSSTSTTTPVGQQSEPIAPPSDVNGPENNPPIGRLSIPAIGLDTRLEEGIRLTTLNRGPGHWPGTAMPGEIGNSVIAGHRTSHNAEFYHLDKLVPGDAVIFTTATGVHTYRVNRTQIVTPDAMWITERTSTATATLFACHPLHSTRQRIVVFLDLAT